MAPLTVGSVRRRAYHHLSRAVLERGAGCLARQFSPELREWGAHCTGGCAVCGGEYLPSLWPYEVRGLQACPALGARQVFAQEMDSDLIE